MDEAHRISDSSILENAPPLQAGILHLSGAESGGLIYTEQVAADGFCSARNRPWLVAINQNIHAAVAFRPSCKSWSCPACALANRKRWIAIAINGVKELNASGQAVDFTTITSHPQLGAARSFQVFPHAWKSLYRRYKRELAAQGQSAPTYLGVPERHQDGRLHSHLINSPGLPERWWKDNAAACGLGYMADVEEGITLGVGGYVGKYLGKTLGEPWPRHSHRVRTSQNWPKLPPPDPKGWTFRKVPSDHEIAAVLDEFAQMDYATVLASAEGAWRLLDALPLDQLL